MSDFAFHPALDPTALSQAWEPGDRLHIPNILSQDTADRLADALGAERDWTRSVTMRSGSFHVPLVGNEPQTATHRKWLDDAVVDGGDSEMQYVYDSRPLGSGGTPLPPRADILDDFHAWLNEPEQVEMLRAITGSTQVEGVYCQASRFLPGHVLTRHNDKDAGRRLFAHVFNLTRAWNADWGGLLVFYDRSGQISRGFVPVFNSLNLFRTPQNHSVTQVATFAQGERLAISGWLMA